MSKDWKFKWHYSAKWQKMERHTNYNEFIVCTGEVSAWRHVFGQKDVTVIQIDR